MTLFADGQILTAAELNDAFATDANVSIVSILQYGGDHTNVSDNSTALANAIISCPSGRVAIFFPPGKYKFNAHYTFTLPAGISLSSIIGAGQDITELFWPNTSGGLSIVYGGSNNSVHVRDLTFTTGQSGTATALSIVGMAGLGSYEPTSDITSVTTRGADGYGAAAYWLTGISLNKCSWFNLVNCYDVGPTGVGGYALSSGGGTGLSLLGDATNVLIVVNVINCAFSLRSIGISIGTQAQGITVDQTNFTGCYVGISVAAGSLGLDQITVTESQFNCSNSGYKDNTGANATSISNNLFIVPSGAIGIDFEKYYFCQVTDNIFNALSGFSGTGIKFVTPLSAQISCVNGGIIEGLATGISIDATSVGINIGHDIAYISNTNNIINAAGNAVQILSGSGYLQAIVSAAASGTGGVVRLTTGSTAGFITGQYVMAWLVGTSSTAGVFQIRVVDSTHLELYFTAFVNTFTGLITTIP